VPVGAWLVGRVSRDAFTRLVMGMDGLVVSFGLSQAILKLKWVGSTLSDLVFGVLAAVFVGLASYSLYRLPGSRKIVDSATPAPLGPENPGGSIDLAVSPVPGRRRVKESRVQGRPLAETDSQSRVKPLPGSSSPQVPTEPE